MGQILTVKNLRAYEPLGAKLGWPLPDLLYQKVPVLAYRNYFCNFENDQWPACWDSSRIVVALRLAVDILSGWRAFRPFPASEILPKLESDFPKIALRLQPTLQTRARQGISVLEPNTPATNEVVIAIAQATSQVSAVKGTRNPMLGSKILAFFFPDFFPVWDTEWVKNKALAKVQLKTLPDAVEARLKGDEAALEYAHYVSLMLDEASQISDADYDKLVAECLAQCRAGGYSGEKAVAEEFY